MAGTDVAIVIGVESCRRRYKVLPDRAARLHGRDLCRSVTIEQGRCMVESRQRGACHRCPVQLIELGSNISAGQVPVDVARRACPQSLVVRLAAQEEGRVCSQRENLCPGVIIRCGAVRRVCLPITWGQRAAIFTDEVRVESPRSIPPWTGCHWSRMKRCSGVSCGRISTGHRHWDAGRIPGYR